VKGPKARANLGPALIVGIFAATASLVFAFVPITTSGASSKKPLSEWTITVPFIELPYQNKMAMIFNEIRKVVLEANQGSALSTNFPELFAQCAALRTLRKYVNSTTHVSAISLEKGSSKAGDKIYTNWFNTTLHVGAYCGIFQIKPSASTFQALMGAIVTQNSANRKLINFLPKWDRPT
jgi:hypothetical protein